MWLPPVNKVWSKNFLAPRYCGLSLLRTPKCGAEGVRYSGSWLYDPNLFLADIATVPFHVAHIFDDPEDGPLVLAAPIARLINTIIDNACVPAE